MTHIKTAGELRGFLAEVLTGIRDGSIGVAEASAISKVAAQINQSLAVEVNTALQLQKMGKDHPAAGSMLIASGTSMAIEQPPAAERRQPPKVAAPLVPPDDGKTWCEQCEMRVSRAQIEGCKSKFCVKLKAVA